MHSKILSMLALVSLASACGESDTNSTDKSLDHAMNTDGGGKGEADASKPEVDANKPPRDCDKLDTPGNDCADAVGCRDALECGLDTSSCCVPGFDVTNVKCVDDVECAQGAGRASCDGPEDCSGKACCVDIVKGTTDCLDSCGEKTALCHSDADCESPKVCNPGGSFTWWGVCS